MQNYFFILSIIILGCTQPKIKSISSNIDGQVLSFSAIHILLFDDISVTWNSSTNDFEKDIFYKKLQKDIHKYKFILTNMIADTTDVNVSVCRNKYKLFKGDVAYILLDKLIDLPKFKIFNMQFDVYDEKCKNLHYEFIDFIQKNRLFVKNKVKKYFEKSN